MHLINSQQQELSDTNYEPISQSQAEVVFLSFADSDLALLSQAYQQYFYNYGNYKPNLNMRAVSLQHINSPFLLDHYIEHSLQFAKLVVVRLLGGREYWRYGLDALLNMAKKNYISGKTTEVFIITADGIDWHELANYCYYGDDLALKTSTVRKRQTNGAAIRQQLEEYTQHGGVDNYYEMVLLLANRLGIDVTRPIAPPKVILPAGFMSCDDKFYDYNRYCLEKPSVFLLFYRAQFQSGQTDHIKKLLQQLQQQGIAAVGFFLNASKDKAALEILSELWRSHQPKIILSSLNFANGNWGEKLSDSRTNDSINANLNDKDLLVNSTNGNKNRQGNNLEFYKSPLNHWGLSCPILQLLVPNLTEQQWLESTRGLSAKDAAISVVLPEMDGAIASFVIGFKDILYQDKFLEWAIKGIKAYERGITELVRMVSAYLVLQQLPNDKKKIAVVLSQYPMKDSRLMNGVGLDTPKSLATILQTLLRAGYDIIHKNDDEELDFSLPPNQLGQQLIKLMASGITNSYRGDAEQNKRVKKIRIIFSEQDYQNYFSKLDKKLQTAVLQHWGKAKDDAFYDYKQNGFYIMAVELGKLLLLLQPQRSFKLDDEIDYHSPLLPPPHYYLAQMGYLNQFAPHAMIHLGKHGNLEWLPGKSLALDSISCFPKALTPAIPYFYPFIINDPGEGSQAKRRTSSVILSHLPPPMLRAELSPELEKLEWLIDEYQQAKLLRPDKLAGLEQQLREAVEKSEITKELGFTTLQENNPNKIRQKFSGKKLELKLREHEITAVDNYLCQLKELQIRGGLHHFAGEIPPNTLIETLWACLKLPNPRSGHMVTANTTQKSYQPIGLSSTIWGGLGQLDSFAFLQKCNIFSEPSDKPLADNIRKSNSRDKLQNSNWANLKKISLKPIYHYGDVRSLLNDLGITWLQYILLKNSRFKEKTTIIESDLIAGRKNLSEYGHELVKALAETKIMLELKEFILQELLPKILLSPQLEGQHLMLGLQGAFVPPNGSGAITRGRVDLLPTGYNFYSVDTRKVPTPAAFQLGQKAGQLLLDRYYSEKGEFPKLISMTCWGTANMRTGGEDIAEALWLMGVEPEWHMGTGRVTGFRILPLSLLNRPRVEVLLRISGFFRDAFQHLIELFVTAAEAVQKLDEPLELNPAKARFEKERDEWLAKGCGNIRAEELARAVVFGPAPMAYGAGLQSVLEEGRWQNRSDLAQYFIAATSHSYGKTNQLGESSRSVTEVDNDMVNNISNDKRVLEQHGFANRLSKVSAILQNQDNREHDILDSDDYYQFQGGMFAAVEWAKNFISKDINTTPQYHNDSSNPEQLTLRSLEEEIGLIVRGRATNPKWLNRMKQHGYKGGFEMAATLDYLFGFAATTGKVSHLHFEMLFQHYLCDIDMRNFLEQYNPAALRDMAQKFQEAIDRKIWQPRHNDSYVLLTDLLQDK